MKPACEWRATLQGLAHSAGVELVEGRGGKPALRVRGVFLHSQYNPEQEAARLIESAQLDPSRPVIVFGLGLGYHVRVLLDAGMRVGVIEPDAGVAQLGLQQFPDTADFPLAVGSVDTLGEVPAFRAFAAESPQVLIHPPTARLYPELAASVPVLVSRAAFAGQHLNIAIVGPMYGGSLPIAGYLTRAFRELGHNAVSIDNDAGWPLYQSITKSVEDTHASNQLGSMCANLLAEWTYARVVEFQPEICIVLAQAPVGPQFPLRLAKLGIVTAFWYVENWRHLPYWKDIAPCYDYFFHIQPGEFQRQLETIGCRRQAFVQTGCDPALHRPVELTPEEQRHYGCDISFAGAGYHNRLQVFRGLTDYDFKIWGVDWPDRALAKKMPDGERRFDSEVFMKIAAATRINLNLHSSATHDGIDPKCDAINPRVFELAAAGAFQVCDPCIGLETHFDLDNEVPAYRDLKELRDKIDYYLAHPAERIAAAKRAQKRALAEHTYQHRARQMLDLIVDAHGARILKHGVRVQRTVGEVLDRVGAESELGAWLATLPKELLFTQEAITTMLGPMRRGMPYPERLFRYLYEVRNFAESLLKAPR